MSVASSKEAIFMMYMVAYEMLLSRDFLSHHRMCAE